MPATALKWISVLIILALTGCAGSSGHNPIEPSLSNQTTPSISNRYLWGLWSITVDPVAGTAVAAPDRAAEMHLNVVRLLEQTACTNCLSISNVTLYGTDELTADVTVKHPFPGLDNFTAFDVRGVFVSGADYTFQESGRMVAWGDEIPRVLNADGYTSLFNLTEFPETSPGPPCLRYIPGKYAPGGDLSANLNPYWAFNEDTERRMFAAGSWDTRTIRLRLPDGLLEFGYIVDGCWQPVTGQVTDPLTDFPPEANCIEAYRIDVAVGAGLDQGVGSAVPVEVEVFDHQGLATISSVSIECPEVFTGVQELTYSGQVGDESWLYMGTITNETGVDVGEYPLLVRVSDTSEDQNLGMVDAWDIDSVEVGPKKGWAKTWGNELGMGVRANAIDGDNNVYMYGSFGGTVDFDPGPGIVERISTDAGDGFLSKFDTDGNFLWVITLDGAGAGMISDEIGNVYITGSFDGTVDFDPGPGIEEHIAYGDIDAFLCKIDTNGNYQWARTWGSDHTDYAVDVGIDNDDHVYITGHLSSYTFDPGSGVVEVYDWGGQFLNKFDSNGNYQWIVQLQGHSDSGANQKMPNICIDKYDNIYIFSVWWGTVDFDPGLGVDERSACTTFDLYLQKFNSNGIHQWVRTWGADAELGARDVAVDEAGNIYVLGLFNDKADLNPGSGVEEHWSQLDGPMTVSKFYPNGEFQWVRIFGGYIDGSHNAKCYGRGICIDNYGEILITGEFGETIDLDPGPGVDNHTAFDYYDAFLVKIHSSGDFVWAKKWGGIWETEGYCLVVDTLNDAYVTGFYMETVDFDPGPGIEEHTSNGLGDAFLSKFPPDGNW